MTVVRVLRCTHCGADVEVASASSLVVTCTHCNTLLLRTDVEAEDLGRIALPVALASKFQRGTTGRYRQRRFEVRGRLQLDHGAGPWNEWAAETSDGAWLWIAEAQGELWVFEECAPTDRTQAALDAVAGRSYWGEEGDDKGALRAGEQVELEGHSWLVIELGLGEVLTCEGELPISPAIGSRTRYIDLGRGARSVATIDLTRERPELLIGERVSVAELELDPASQPSSTRVNVEALRLRCPACDGELTVHAPLSALRVACVHCHAVLAPSGEARDAGDLGATSQAAGSAASGRGIGSTQQRASGAQLFGLLAAQENVAPKSPVPIGSAGRLAGTNVTVVGAMGRRVRAEGRWYPWRELLLRSDEGAYLWLVESSGHWLLARPLAPSAVSLIGNTARHGGQEFKHFTGGQAEVHWVLGEFYWRVAAGDVAEVADYVAPKLGRAVSTERTPRELAASLVEHLDSEEVRAAFGLARLPVEPEGVGMLQANPTALRHTWRVVAGALLALFVLRFVFGAVHGNEVVFDEELGPTPSTAGSETVDLTEPLELRRGPANLRIDLEAPNLLNGWLGLTGALVEETSGNVTTFGVEAQRYSGVTGGESWSEGKRRGHTYLGSIPRGTYRLRFAVQGYDAGLNRNYRVRVTSQVPRTGLMWLWALPLLIAGAVFTIRWIMFESGRWKDSDHPWFESS